MADPGELLFSWSRRPGTPKFSLCLRRVLSAPLSCGGKLSREPGQELQSKAKHLGSFLSDTIADLFFKGGHLKPCLPPLVSAPHQPPLLSKEINECQRALCRHHSWFGVCEARAGWPGLKRLLVWSRQAPSGAEAGL